MAGYNNYFPQSYTPYSYGAGVNSAQTWGQPSSLTNTFGAINWVQGEAGAKSVNVPAGQRVLLMDSETNVFYIKSSDTSGMPLPMRTFKYEEVVGTTPTIESAQSTYITKEELDKRLEEFAKSLTEKEKSNEKFDL